MSPRRRAADVRTVEILRHEESAVRLCRAPHDVRINLVSEGGEDCRTLAASGPGYSNPIPQRAGGSREFLLQVRKTDALFQLLSRRTSRILRKPVSTPTTMSVPSANPFAKSGPSSIPVSSLIKS